MPNLKEIKNRIKSIESIHQLTKAMKLIASSKIRKMELQFKACRPYAQLLVEIMSQIYTANKEITHPFLNSSNFSNKVGVIVIASDKGLCGGYNNSVFKRAEQLFEELREQGKKYAVYAVGMKSLRYFKYRSHEILFTKDNSLSLPLSDQLYNKVSYDFLDGQIDSAYIVAPVAYSRSSYEVEVTPFLPFAIEMAELENNNFIFEPSVEQSIDLLLPLLLRRELSVKLAGAQYAEYVARIIAMTNACDNAESLVSDLRLSYFRARQAAITTEILEVSAGAAQES